MIGGVFQNLAVFNVKRHGTSILHIFNTSRRFYARPARFLRPKSRFSVDGPKVQRTVVEKKPTIATSVVAELIREDTFETSSEDLQQEIDRSISPRFRELEGFYNSSLIPPSFALESTVIENKKSDESPDLEHDAPLEDLGADPLPADENEAIGNASFYPAPLTQVPVAREKRVLELYGSPDPSQPITKVPCAGCGAHLHCQDPGIPGYLPSQSLLAIPSDKLRSTICQRCTLLEKYNVAVDVSVSAADYAKIVGGVAFEKALVVVVIDLTDLPNSIYQALPKLIGSRRRPMYIVGNKVDLLPQDSKGFLKRIKQMVEKYMDKYHFSSHHFIQHISLVSAKTGYGIEELVTQLMKHWARKGHVYVVGCTNVGKSSLFNALLSSDYCNSGARDFIHRATISQWPGTTLNTLKFPIVDPTGSRLHRRTQRLLKERPEHAEEAKLQRYNLKESGALKYATLMGHIGQTFLGSKETKLVEMPYQGDLAPMFEFVDGQIKPGISSKWKEIKEKVKKSLEEYNEERYANSRFCVDTPGVVNPEQIINILTQEELSVMLTRRLIQPRSYVLKPGQVLLISGLSRIEYIAGEKSIYFTVFSSMRLPVHYFYNSKDADDFYQENLGTESLGLPLGDKDRMLKVPALIGKEFNFSGLNPMESAADIVLSSVGWVAVTTSAGHDVTVRGFTPGGLGCHLRQPAMFPFAINLRGKRRSHSRAFEVKRPKVFS